MNTQSKAMKICFEARPMDTAPKDRYIMGFIDGQWELCMWDDQRYHANPRPYWRGYGSQRLQGVAWSRAHQPTLWAEIEDMKPEKP